MSVYPQQDAHMMQQHMQAPVVQQPVMQQSMMANTNINVITQPAPFGRPAAYPQNVREFSTGICGCCSDLSSCLYGYFCLPCLACNVAGRLGEDCCCTGCCCAPTSWIAMRTKLRTLFGIKGSIPSDICCLTCCQSLAICQMARELQNFGL